MTTPEDVHGELADLAWIEALGALDVGDRARLAAHLREGCPSCLEALRGGSDVVAKLAHLFSPAEPSDLLRARIASANARRVPAAAAELRRPPRRARLASAASWVALGVAAVLGWSEWRDARSAREQLARERANSQRALETARERSDALAREHAELNELLAAVTAPGARQLALTGEADAHAAVYVARDRLVLIARGLPRVPAGMAYQAWVIEGGVPRSAGVFDADESGSARHRATFSAPLAADAAIAVTLEPAGGVPQPTGALVLAVR